MSNTTKTFTFNRKLVKFGRSESRREGKCGIDVNSLKKIKKDKNDRSRFLGEGVSYKAKLIGILEVSEARGDRMCQEALADLKMAIRAAGEHKQRININIAIDGLRLRDEKTGDCLYHHPVHKISFIAQDMTDSRAFGYIFGSPDTGHRFFGIKTDKAASQVVISMRDLFQVVFELKKKEIEMAKQQIEQHHIKFTSSLSPECGSSHKIKVSPSFGTSSKASIKLLSLNDELRDGNSIGNATSEDKVMDLLDLELELNNIQQGINQMEKITPSDPFGPSSTKVDPFGDSFNPPSNQAKLPPPPESSKRSKLTEKHWYSQDSEFIFEDKDKVLATNLNNESPIPNSSKVLDQQLSIDNTTEIIECIEEPVERTTSPKEQFDVFTELDPLGTGKSKPYIDKKDFFQELKNPPKKMLKDLVSDSFSDNKCIESNDSDDKSLRSDKIVAVSGICTDKLTDPFQDDPFDKDPFLEVEFPQSTQFKTTISKSDPFERFADFTTFNIKLNDRDIEKGYCIMANTFEVFEQKKLPLKVTLPSENATCSINKQQSKTSSFKFPKYQKTMSDSEIKRPSSAKFKSIKNSIPDRYAVTPLDIESILAAKSDFDESSTHMVLNFGDTNAPEPPPRSQNAQFIKPPPLPPKKCSIPAIKQMVRPPNSDYDYIENCHSKPYPLINSPPIPAPARKPKSALDSEYYLQPFPLLPPPKKKIPVPPKEVVNEQKDKEFVKTLDITLSQLTKTGFSELATSLNMSPTTLSKMTLQELTKCISSISDDQNNTKSSTNGAIVAHDMGHGALNSTNFTAEFDTHFTNIDSTCVENEKEKSLFDKYAVFRELVEQEQQSVSTFKEEEKDDESKNFLSNLKLSTDKNSDSVPVIPPTEDRYAALRDICIDSLKENEEDNSDREDSIIETSRLEEDTDLLPSHPHSESTESPTITMKEHQSIMEATILEEDVSAMDPDDDEVLEETLEDSIHEPAPKQVERVLSIKSFEHVERIISSSHEEETDDNKLSPVDPITTTWTQFDNSNDVASEKHPSVHSDGGQTSPWSTDSKLREISPTFREQKKYRRSKKQRYKYQDDEESEEGWETRMGSSWSPSWRENGWSDADSLCDESHSYMEREYHSPWRNRRRRMSPWDSREHSPWEEDDTEDQWDSCRWSDEQRRRHRGPSWEEERRRYFEDLRKSRKQINWSSDIDRKSSRESLTWDDDDRYARRNYPERRLRKRDDDIHSRSKKWKDREWSDGAVKPSRRYYREKPADYDDEYHDRNEEGSHWTKRTRSCDRGRRQHSGHHGSDVEYSDRRYGRSSSREDYSPEIEYRRKTQTLQSQKLRKKHNPTSPFGDDFASQTSLSKEAEFAESNEIDIKKSASHNEINKKNILSEAKQRDYCQCVDMHSNPLAKEGLTTNKPTRSFQQSPFEDDFTPSDTRRCSGKSISSDISDPKSFEEMSYPDKNDLAKSSSIDSSRNLRKLKMPESNKLSKSFSQGTTSCSSNDNQNNKITSDKISNVIYSHDKKFQRNDLRMKTSNTNREDNSMNLKKSESVNIFARNKDPFDDDFFAESSQSASYLDNKQRPVNDINKWSESFNAFNFENDHN